MHYKALSIHLLFIHLHTRQYGGEVAVVPDEQPACRGSNKALQASEYITTSWTPGYRRKQSYFCDILEALWKSHDIPREIQAYMGHRQCPAPAKSTASQGNLSLPVLSTHPGNWGSCPISTYPVVTSVYHHISIALNISPHLNWLLMTVVC